MLKRVLLTLLLVAAFLTTFTFTAKFPTLHRDWIRSQTADKIFEVKGKEDGGGGTGFAIEAPSGITYIVTNSHVCEFALKDANSKNLVLVVRDDHPLKRRVLEISGESDLCIIEGWPGVKGLKVGSEAKIGDVLYEVGHPSLMPTTMVEGEVTSQMDVDTAHHLMNDTKLGAKLGGTDEPCNLPKEKVLTQPILLFGVIPVGDVHVCVATESDALATTLLTYPGNSGSPVVNKWGNVVGVAFASDNQTHWGCLVNLEHLKDFIKDF